MRHTADPSTHLVMGVGTIVFPAITGSTTVDAHLDVKSDCTR